MSLVGKRCHLSISFNGLPSGKNQIRSWQNAKLCLYLHLIIPDSEKAIRRRIILDLPTAREWDHSNNTGGNKSASQGQRGVGYHHLALLP